MQGKLVLILFLFLLSVLPNNVISLCNQLFNVFLHLSTVYWILCLSHRAGFLVIQIPRYRVSALTGILYSEEYLQLWILIRSHLSRFKHNPEALENNSTVCIAKGICSLFFRKALYHPPADL